jgi:predicted DNA-binding protein (MmcQ/YjbR family)
MLSEAQILERLRATCRALPAVEVTTTFGHPTFRVGGKMFAILEEYKGELGICIRVEKELQGIFLDDSRFFRTPYIGKHGWVTLKIYSARLNWTEIKDLVRGSYRLVVAAAPKSRKGTSQKTRQKQNVSRRRKRIY